MEKREEIMSYLRSFNYKVFIRGLGLQNLTTREDICKPDPTIDFLEEKNFTYLTRAMIIKDKSYTNNSLNEMGKVIEFIFYLVTKNNYKLLKILLKERREEISDILNDKNIIGSLLNKEEKKVEDRNPEKIKLLTYLLNNGMCFAAVYHGCPDALKLLLIYRIENLDKRNWNNQTIKDYAQAIKNYTKSSHSTDNNLTKIENVIKMYERHLEQKKIREQNINNTIEHANDSNRLNTSSLLTKMDSPNSPNQPNILRPAPNTFTPFSQSINYNRPNNMPIAPLASNANYNRPNNMLIAPTGSNANHSRPNNAPLPPLDSNCDNDTQTVLLGKHVRFSREILLSIIARTNEEIDRLGKVLKQIMMAGRTEENIIKCNEVASRQRQLHDDLREAKKNMDEFGILITNNNLKRLIRK